MTVKKKCDSCNECEDTLDALKTLGVLLLIAIAIVIAYAVGKSADMKVEARLFEYSDVLSKREYAMPSAYIEPRGIATVCATIATDMSLPYCTCSVK